MNPFDLNQSFLKDLKANAKAVEVKSPKLTQAELDAQWAAERRQLDQAVSKVVESISEDFKKPIPDEPPRVLGLHAQLYLQPPKEDPVTAVKIQLEEGGVMPTRGSAGAAGWDLYAAEDAVVIPHAKPFPVSVGFKVSMPSDIEMQIRSRSGLSIKGVVVANAPGTVDSDYRGVVKVILTGTAGLDAPFEIKKGDRIAQAVFAWVPQLSLSQVETLDDTSRGSGGFGSTGK